MFKSTKFFKSKSVLILLFFSLICLVYLYFSSKNPPQKAPFSILPTPTPSSDVRSNQPAFNVIKKYRTSLNFNLSVPPSLPIYNAQPSAEDLNSLAQKIVQKFNLQADPNNNIIWSSTDRSQYFVVDYKNDYLNFSNTERDQKFSEHLDQTLAIKTAQNFLNQFFSSLNLDKNPSHIVNIYAPQSGADADITTKDKANLYTFSFASKINNYPFYVGANLLDTLNITVSPGNTVSKFTYKSQPLPTLSNPQDKPLINKEKISQLLDSGVGEIAYIDILDVPFQGSSIPDVIISNYVLEYRFNESKKMVIPYYRFFGAFTSQFTQAKANVTLILPAVEL